MLIYCEEKSYVLSFLPFLIHLSSKTNFNDIVIILEEHLSFELFFIHGNASDYYSAHEDARRMMVPSAKYL
jgi:hypothetical protein